MGLSALAPHLVAPLVVSLVWLFTLRRMVARAYERGRSSLDTTAEYGKGYELGYSLGWAAYERCHTPEMADIISNLRKSHPQFFPPAPDK